MYKIIGADNREYGPISSDQLREWIRQGRANTNTLVQPEGSTEWKRVSSLPEFADLGQVPPLVGNESSAEADRIKDLASKKIAAGICGILIGSFGVHKFILGYTTAGTIMLLVTILTCGIGGVVMWIIGLIEGILYLCKSDREFVETYIHKQKEWF